MPDLLNTIQKLNPHISVYDINSDEFLPYGKVIEGYDFSALLNIMGNREIPESGNIYTGLDKEMTASEVSTLLSENFYGHMPIQIGYCNGNSYKLNALEYHKGSEIDIAVTDLVLLLGDMRDIKNNTFSSSRVKAFVVPAGTACELYATTLHFAPCKVSDDGYKSIIVLPYATNLPLDKLPEARNDEDKLLWQQNKWLIAHPDSIPASKGACAGITGDNIENIYK